MRGGGGLRWWESDWSITPLNEKRLYSCRYIMCGKHEIQHGSVYLHTCKVHKNAIFIN